MPVNKKSKSADTKRLNFLETNTSHLQINDHGEWFVKHYDGGGRSTITVGGDLRKSIDLAMRGKK